MSELGAGLYLVVVIALLVLFVLWVLMPLAVFGIKGLLSQTLWELRQANKLLAELKQGRDGTATAPEPRRETALEHLTRTPRFSGSPDLPPT